MFEAKVYRVVLSSLGAILAEEYLAKETIQKWNNERAEETGKLFLILPDGTSTTPDFYVVIIDSFIDPAKVNMIIAMGLPVLLFFSKYHDPKNSMRTELDAIDAYRSIVQKQCKCLDYEGLKSFSKVLLSSLNSINN